jgi:hypothetical protein
MQPASAPVNVQSSAPRRSPSGPPDRSHRPPAPKIEWGRLFKEGWKLIFLSPGLVSLYILLFLLNGFAGIYAASYLGKITGAPNGVANQRAPATALRLLCNLGSSGIRRHRRLDSAVLDWEPDGLVDVQQIAGLGL